MEDELESYIQKFVLYYVYYFRKMLFSFRVTFYICFGLENFSRSPEAS